jgi:polyisoprenyl-phosphate glycosyltransferase
MKSGLKRISVVTGCFNEEENVNELYEQVKAVFVDLPQYEYEHIFIDNSSKDRTVEILKEIAHKDHRVKIIVNTRNFGHIRSPYHALMQATGDAVISIVADLQDPPTMIREFINQWEEGYKIVIGVKTQSEESPFFFAIRKAYYTLVGRLSEVELIKNFTGFGLYDQKVIETFRGIDDPYPYFRGLISDIGFERAVI